MTQKRKRDLNDREVYLEMVRDAATALTYTDEEIRATLEGNDAQEFIDLRNRVLASLEEEPYRYDTADDTDIPMAAEDDASYTKE